MSPFELMHLHADVCRTSRPRISQGHGLHDVIRPVAVITVAMASGLLQMQRARRQRWEKHGTADHYRDQSLDGLAALDSAGYHWHV